MEPSFDILGRKTGVNVAGPSSKVSVCGQPEAPARFRVEDILRYVASYVKTLLNACQQSGKDDSGVTCQSVCPSVYARQLLPQLVCSSFKKTSHLHDETPALMYSAISTLFKGLLLAATFHPWAKQSSQLAGAGEEKLARLGTSGITKSWG